MSDATEIILRDPAAGQAAIAEPQLTGEARLLDLWLHGLSRHTRRAYSTDWARFRLYCALPLDRVTLADLQAFADHLGRQPGREPGSKLREGSRHRILSGVKSFFSFATRLGVLPYDVSRPLRLPGGKDALNERILDEGDVAKLIDAAGAGPHGGRNRLIAELLYVAGVRVNELAGLCWRDARPRTSGGQITLLGKGMKTRTVLVPADTWDAMLAFRGTAADADSVFGLSVSQMARVIKGAAIVAGVTARVSPHWLRHCHCSHALDHGAPIHLVQATVGHASVATTSRYLHARPAESSSSFLPARKRAAPPSSTGSDGAARPT